MPINHDTLTDTITHGLIDYGDYYEICDDYDTPENAYEELWPTVDLYITEQPNTLKEWLEDLKAYNVDEDAKKLDDILKQLNDYTKEYQNDNEQTGKDLSFVPEPNIDRFRNQDK